MADIIAVRGVSGMNHKFDQVLTISALTGWVASIAALLAIGVNSRSFTSLGTQIAPEAARSAQVASTLLPLKVAKMQLGNAIVSPELPFAALDSQHWLDRRVPPPNLLNLASPAAPAPPQPLWLSHADSIEF
jgi:hypothetical protein